MQLENNFLSLQKIHKLNYKIMEEFITSGHFAILLNSISIIMNSITLILIKKDL